ncbi:response regulator [Thermodesulfobacteriota bacterium]
MNISTQHPGINPAPFLSVLIVDTDDSSALNFKQWIERMGSYRVDVCTRPSQALEKLSMKTIDLMLLDMMFLESVASDLISRFLEHYPDLKIVAMTAENSRDIERRAREQKVVYYFVKPISFSQLEELLSHLRKTKQWREDAA